MTLTQVVSPGTPWNIILQYRHFFSFTSAIFSAMPLETMVYEYQMAVFTLYRIAFTPTRNPYQIELLFTHKNGAISVTERSGVAQTSKVGRHISDRFCTHFEVV